MPNCSKCGKELRSDDMFCPYCGQKTGFQDKQDLSAITRPGPQSRSTASAGSLGSLSAGSGSADVFEQLSARVSQKKSGAVPAASGKKPSVPAGNNSRPAKPSSGKITAADEDVIEYSNNPFYISNNKELDIRKSVLFCRLHDAEMSRQKNSEFQSSVIMFIASGCRKYASEHRDFPNRTDMLAMYNAIANKDTGTFTDHACNLMTPLYQWAGDHPEDIEAWTLFAGLGSLAENDEAHFSLLIVLMSTLQGKPLDKTYKNLWLTSALHLRFEAWLKDYAGVYMTGYSPFHNKPAEW